MRNKKVFGQTMSVTELSQNASGAIKRVEVEKKPLVIMKNNKPVAVLMDIDTYEELDAIAEDLYWTRVAEERIANDNGKRYTLEEAMAYRAEYRKNLKKKNKN